jgi:hypothetical protein
MPDGRITQVRFEALVSRRLAFPFATRFKLWFTYAPTRMVCSQLSSISWPRLSSALCPTTARYMETPSTQSPLARSWRYLHGRRGPPPARTLLPGHCYSGPSYYRLIRRSRWTLLYFGLSLVRGVSAGCYQPLRSAGPSRGYLCESFLGCLGPCTEVPRSAHACFFLHVIGLPRLLSGSASAFPRQNDFTTDRFFGTAAFYFIRSATTGFTVNLPPFRSRVSLKEAFAGLELCAGKLACIVLRGAGPQQWGLATGFSSEAAEWYAIDWQAIHRNVRRLQVRIVKAVKEGRWGKVRALQRLLTHSYSGKVLAVRRVEGKPRQEGPGGGSGNLGHPGKEGAGRTETQAEGLSTSALRRVYIPKSDGVTMRLLGIPAIQSVWQ